MWLLLGFRFQLLHCRFAISDIHICTICGDLLPNPPLLIPSYRPGPTHAIVYCFGIPYRLHWHCRPLLSPTKHLPLFPQIFFCRACLLPFGVWYSTTLVCMCVRVCACMCECVCDCVGESDTQSHSKVHGYCSTESGILIYHNCQCIKCHWPPTFLAKQTEKETSLKRYEMQILYAKRYFVCEFIDSIRMGNFRLGI